MLAQLALLYTARLNNAIKPVATLTTKAQPFYEI